MSFCDRHVSRYAKEQKAHNVRDMTQRILSKIACSGCAARGAVYADTQALRRAGNVRDMIQIYFE